MTKKIAIVVNNSIAHDNRVLREASVLQNAGFNVRLFGRTFEKNVIFTTINGLSTTLVPHSRSLKLFIHSFTHLCFSNFIMLTMLFILSPLIFISFLVIIVGKLFKLQYNFLNKIAGRYNLENTLRLSYSLKVIHLYSTSKIYSFLNHFFSQWLLFQDCYISLKKPILDWQPDLIHVHDLHTLRLGFNIAQQLSIPFIYEAHEFELSRTNINIFWHKLFIRLEESAYIKSADAVITVSEGIAKLLAKIYGIPVPMIIYNSPIINNLNPIKTTIRHDLKLPAEVPILLYVGGVTVFRGIEDLIEAIKIMPDWVLVLMGPTNNQAYIKKLNFMITSCELNNRIFILPPVPGDQVVTYIQDADVSAIILRRESISYEYCLPNKLFESTFAGLAIMATSLKSLKQYIKVNECGTLIPVNQIDKYTIKAAIEKAYQLKKMKKLPCREKLIEKYGWISQQSKLTMLYQRLLNSPQTSEKLIITEQM